MICKASAQAEYQMIHSMPLACMQSPGSGVGSIRLSHDSVVCANNRSGSQIRHMTKRHVQTRHLQPPPHIQTVGKPPQQRTCRAAMPSRHNQREPQCVCSHVMRAVHTARPHTPPKGVPAKAKRTSANQRFSTPPLQMVFVPPKVR